MFRAENLPSKKPTTRCMLIFDPEDGSDRFLQNVGSHTDYAATFNEMFARVHSIQVTQSVV
jgi:hypothetical protein